MASLNQCNFIGNVGSIETKYLPSGEGVTNLNLAVNDKYKNKAGELVDSTEWVRVSFFGKLSEVCEKWVKKGDPLYVSGQMKTRKYTNKDGVDVYTTEIRGERMQMLGGKSDDKPAKQAQPAGGFDDMDSDIPF